MTRKAAPNTDAITLIKVFFETYEAMSSAVADVLEELDLTQSQASMLWALEPSSPPSSMRELARKLHFDPSNITLMTDRLVTMGLVERKPHPTDGRQRILALTAQGLKVWHLLVERLEQRSPVFTALTRHEQTQLTRLLAKAQAKSPLF
jgi:DNA-binding MarR family transcriptional regulator